MDSITQATLGAAIGEAVLGRRVGPKAAAWGAALGTLPDLDVLADPFVTNAQALLIHRGTSHGIFFALVVAPLVGLLLARLHRADDVPWTRWAFMAWLVLATHPLLDALTIYGTQLLAPVSRYPFQVGSVFIIDPLYTVPLLIGVVAALFMRRRSRARRWASGVGLGLSTLYLLWGLGAHAHAADVFDDAYAAAGLEPRRTLTGATPLNTLLWMGIADTGDSLYVGLYSLLDNDRRIDFRAVPKRPELLRPHLEAAAVERLLWFSRGFFQMERRGGDLLLHDLRFGRTDGWLTDEGAYIFTFRLEQAPGGEVVGFEQQQPELDRFSGDAFRRLWQRMLGR